MAGRGGVKQTERRLKVDKMRGEGLTHMQIAKKLKVTVMTIKRDVRILDEELQVEPQYSDERKKNREIAVRTLWKWIKELTDDLNRARLGSETSEKTGKPPLQAEIKKVSDPEVMVGIALDEVKSFAITEKIFGPDWKAIAQMYKVRLEHLVTFAKLWGLLVERETQITKETTSETIVEGQMVLPPELPGDQWQELAHECAETGKKPAVVQVKDLEKCKSEGGVEVWEPKKTSPPSKEGEEEG